MVQDQTLETMQNNIHPIETILKNRLAALYDLNHTNFRASCISLLQDLEANFATKALLLELEVNEASTEILEFYTSLTDTIHNSLRLPMEHKARILAYYRLIQKFASGEAPLNSTKWNYLNTSGNIGNLKANVVREFIHPVVEYLTERLDHMDSLLYCLLRYRSKVEWFQRDSLRSRYESDLGRGEEILTTHLQEYLFDQGVDFPFSTPDGPHGRTDLLISWDTNPMPLEVKILAPSREYGLTRIRQGVTQTLKYATDYQASIGYLIVFVPENIAVNSSLDKLHGVPYLKVGGKMLFIITVYMYKIAKSASKDREVRSLDLNYSDIAPEST